MYQNSIIYRVIKTTDCEFNCYTADVFTKYYKAPVFRCILVLLYRLSCVLLQEITLLFRRIPFIRLLIQIVKVLFLSAVLLMFDFSFLLTLVPIS